MEDKRNILAGPGSVLLASAEPTRTSSSKRLRRSRLPENPDRFSCWCYPPKTASALETATAESGPALETVIRISTWPTWRTRSARVARRSAIGEAGRLSGYSGGRARAGVERPEASLHQPAGVRATPCHVHVLGPGSAVRKYGVGTLPGPNPLSANRSTSALKF